MAKHNFRTSVRNGDIIQGDTRPGEVITYQLAAEELARYGPPAEAKRRRALDISKWQRGGNRDMADKTKTCRKCGEDKPAESFRPGWAICNDCQDKAADQAVKDYAAQHGISLEVTGAGALVISTVYAAVDLLDESRRYRVTMSVEEA